MRRIKTFACNKKDIRIENNYYHCIRSYGSFAVIINKCIVMYPNKVIADVSTSNTGKARNQTRMAKQFRWI